MPLEIKGDIVRFIIIAIIWLGSAHSTLAACNLDRVVGFTLVAKKVIVAFIQNDKREEGFSGCKSGRILVFDDNSTVRCTDDNYNRAYRPEAYVFTNSSSIKLCVEGEWMDVQQLR